MDVSIPFQHGMALGRSLDVTKQTSGSFRQGPFLVPDDVKRSFFPVNLTTAKYSISQSFSDVCDILQIPYEYALKVESGQITDDVVTACLKDAEDPETISLSFCITYIQQKRFFSQDIELNRDALRPSTSNGNQTETPTEDSQGYSALRSPVPATEDTQGDSKPNSDIFTATHWVNSLEVGNKLIVICRISINDQEEYLSVFEKLKKRLGYIRGSLEDSQIQGLEKFAKKMDKELKKEYYSEIVKVGIEYCAYSNIQHCPANLTNMVHLIKEFIQICKMWTNLYKHIQPCVFKPMVVRQGKTMPEEKGYVKRLANFVLGTVPVPAPLYFNVPHHHSQVGEGEKNSTSVDGCAPGSVSVNTKKFNEQTNERKACALDKTSPDCDATHHSSDVDGEDEDSFEVLYCQSEIDQKNKTDVESLEREGNTPEELPHEFDAPKNSSDVDAGQGDSAKVDGSGSDSMHSGTKPEMQDDCDAHLYPSDENDGNRDNVEMYLMRMNIQSIETKDSDVNTSGHKSDCPATCKYTFECLHKSLRESKHDNHKLKVFLESDFIQSVNEKYRLETKDLLQKSSMMQVTIARKIDGLDFVSIPTDVDLKSIQDSEKSLSVKEFIENVSTKLPEGPGLDMLIIGKTGHGKSSTCNSILGQEEFESSNSSDSVTSKCNSAWSQVDGRIMKVVDTPGVCDTREDADKTSIEAAINGISEAIVACANGFHALLLVYRYGQRFTKEEKLAIRLLKGIFGEDILKDHCICVVTHGDAFKSDTKTKKTFEEWCKTESKCLKDVFKECQYRCVLFDNQSQDSMVQKRQMIALVSYIDHMDSKGSRYTNDLFKIAQEAQKKAIEEANAPEANEYVMRDVSLVMDNIEKVMKHSNGSKDLKSDLENLKSNVNTLKNNVDGLNEGGEVMKQLTNTVSKLSEILSEIVVGHNDAMDKIKDSHVEDLKQCKEELKKAKQKAAPIVEEVKKQATAEVSPKAESRGGCFTSTSLVTLRDGSQRTMGDLKVGDEVLARNGQGRLVYDTVYMFGHRDVNAISNFRVLETKHEQVSLSRDHMVYCFRNGAETCLPARLIKKGDELLTVSHAGLEKAPILYISSEKRLGLYAPFTNTGTLIVDGALMSCYVDVLPPAKAHNLLKPMRKLYKVSPATLEFINGSKRGSSIPPWARLYLKWKKSL